MKQIKAWLGEDFHDDSKPLAEATDADLEHMTHVYDERWAILSSISAVLDDVRRNFYTMSEMMHDCTDKKWRAASVYAKASKKDRAAFKKTLKLARELSKFVDEWMEERHEYEMSCYGHTITRFYDGY